MSQIVRTKFLNYILTVIDPVRNHCSFFLVITLLMIVPTYLDTFIFEYDGAPVLQKLSRNHNGTSIPSVLFIPFLFAYTSVVLSKLLNCKWILKIVLIIVAGLYGINVFLLFNFKTLISPMILMLIMETNAEESTEFLLSYVFSVNSLWAYLTVGITYSSVWCIGRLKDFFRTILSKRYVKCLLFIIVCYFFYRGTPYLWNFTKMYECKTLMEVETFSYDMAVKTNTLTELLYSIYNMNICKREAMKVVLLASEVPRTLPRLISPQDSLCLIVVIGESYNKYHSSLYGYSLDTTPNMVEARDDSCLYVFNNVITPWNMTSNAIKNIFSLNSIANKESWIDYPLFPSLFKAAGYSVYFWDNQNSGISSDVFDFSLNGIIHNPNIAKVSYDYENSQRYQYDGDLLNSFKEKYHTGYHDLIILHLMGQHIGAKYRYPQDYGKFSINDYTSRKLNVEQKQLVAEYDNATLYNDSILGELFDMFKERDAVLVYFSDHGEEVFDYREVIGRTHEENKSKDNLKYQYDVPFIIWCSKSYADKNQNVINQIRKAKDIPFMTDLIGQMLLGLGEISTKYYYQERDLLNNHYSPFKRIVQGSIDYDKVCSNK